MLDTVLLQIAKHAILSKFDSEIIIDKSALTQKYPYLAQDGACFVTLNHDGYLRGCIGSLIGHRALIDDIISNAQSAAFSDPRFSPLSPEELDKLHLEVSVLSAPEVLEYVDYDDLLTKVRPHIDGLILQHGHHKGTFLPQVWEQLPHAKNFLEQLSYKAGATPAIYHEHPTIYRYGVDAIEEEFDAVLPL